MLNNATTGFRMIKLGSRVNAFAIALFISAAVLVLRGILDSTHRDHIEMQAFNFSLLFVLIIKFRKENEKSVLSNLFE